MNLICILKRNDMIHYLYVYTYLSLYIYIYIWYIYIHWYNSCLSSYLIYPQALNPHRVAGLRHAFVIGRWAVLRTCAQRPPRCRSGHVFVGTNENYWRLNWTMKKDRLIDLTWFKMIWTMKNGIFNMIWHDFFLPDLSVINIGLFLGSSRIGSREIYFWRKWPGRKWGISAIHVQFISQFLETEPIFTWGSSTMEMGTKNKDKKTFNALTEGNIYRQHQKGSCYPLVN